MKTNHTDSHYNPSQGRFPEFFEESLGIDDVVFEFDRIIEEIRIERYLKPAEISFLGRPGYNRVDLLKTSLFGAMNKTLATLRELDDACKVNLRYRHLMKNETPSYRTFGNFIAKELSESIEDIFNAVMEYIRKEDSVDLQRLYIAVLDVQQYRSDMDCFVPLMEKFREQYGFYPKYPVADTGYGSFNNYIFCQNNGMEKYTKFPMYRKETKDAAYRDDPFRAVNFKTDESGELICPNNRKLKLSYRSIQAEGTFGIVKRDRGYRRIRRRGLEKVKLELLLVAIGHNLYKFHNKRKRLKTAA